MPLDFATPTDLWMAGLGCAMPEVFTTAGNGSASFFDGSGGASGTTSFHDPIAIAIGPNGTVFVSDTTNRRIRAVAADGTTTTLAGNGTSGQNDGTGGAGGTATFLSPRGLAFDGNKTLYVADGDLIRTVDTGNGATKLFAGTPGALYAEGTGAGATFSAPVGITFEPTCDCLYIADTGNHLIRVLSTGATSTRLAGTPNNAGYTDGGALTALFSGPNGVAANATSIYVTDLNNHRVRLITLDTGDAGLGAIVSTFSGSGTPGYMEGTALIAQFNFPGGLALGAGGVVYVADSGNDRIRAIAPDGSTSLLAGSGASGFADGMALSASFYDPAAVAFDGGLFIADQLNQRIRRVVCP
jgi:sugar lactone lactonase YvrE